MDNALKCLNQASVLYVCACLTDQTFPCMSLLLEFAE